MPSVKSLYLSVVYVIGRPIRSIRYVFRKAHGAYSATRAEWMAPNDEAIMALVEQPDVRKLIEDGYMTARQFNALNAQSKMALAQPHVRKLIAECNINIEQYAKLSEYAARILRITPQICQTIIEGDLTLEEFKEFMAIAEAHVLQLIAAEHITLEQFNSLSLYATMALQEPHVFQLITNGHINARQYLTLKEGAACILRNSSEVCQLIADKLITLEQFNSLNIKSMMALAQTHVRKLITEGHINIEQYVTLNEDAAYILSVRPEVCQLIVEKIITLEQFNSLNTKSMMALAQTHVRKLITEGHINIEQYVTLNEDVAYLLTVRPEVCQLIADGFITLEQCNSLNNDALVALAQLGVRQLIIARRMTIAQLALINNDELIDAINNDDTLEQILSGQLEVEAVIRRFNGHQSTHTASVHNGASQSARDLYKRYKDKIQGENLDNEIKSLVTKISEYSGPVIAKYNDRNRDCVRYAKECIQRIATAEYSFKDPASEISMHELLAVVSLAIRDTSVLLGGTNDDAIKQIIQGLYEAEREGNISLNRLNEDNEDARSSSACIAGTFNKIIEKLVGIHPDCNLIFISGESVTAKMKIIVLENIAKHIMTKNSFSTFHSSYSKKEAFPDDYWAAIWNGIKDNVKKEASEYYSGNDVIEPRLHKWISDNMALYSCGVCYLSQEDMTAINNKLSKACRDNTLTPIYDLSAKMKRSASLDSPIMATSRPRANTM